MALIDIYVDPDATGGTYDGTSWTTAYQSKYAAYVARAADISAAGDADTHHYHSRASGSTEDATSSQFDLDAMGYVTDDDNGIIDENCGDPISGGEDSHGGAWNTSVYRLRSTFGGIKWQFQNDEFNMEFRGLQFDSNGSVNGNTFQMWSMGANTKMLFDRCIMYGRDSAYSQTTFYWRDAYSGASCIIRNTLIYDYHRGIYTGYEESGALLEVQNCTIVDCLTYGGRFQQAFTASVEVTNTVGFGSTTANLNSSSDTIFLNCADDRTSSSTGWVNLTGETADEIFETPSSDDFHAEVSPGLLDEAGYDLSGTFTVDIDDETRAATWSIGADDPNGTGTSGVTVSPSLITAAAAVLTPTVTGGVLITPALVTSTAAVLTPAVTGGALVTADLATAAAAVLAPTVAGAAAVSPDLATAAAAVFTPVVTAGGSGVTVSPSLVTAAAATLAPAVAAGAAIAADLATATAEVFAPTVTGGARVTPNAGNGYLIKVAYASVLAPAVAGGAQIDAVLAEATVAALAPAVVGGALVSPDLVTATAVVFAPTVNAVDIQELVELSTPLCRAVSLQSDLARANSLSSNLCRSVSLTSTLREV